MKQGGWPLPIACILYPPNGGATARSAHLPCMLSASAITLVVQELQCLASIVYREGPRGIVCDIWLSAFTWPSSVKACGRWVCYTRRRRSDFWLAQGMIFGLCRRGVCVCRGGCCGFSWPRVGFTTGILEKHPQIMMAGRKELHFFDNRSPTKRSSEVYAANFAR